jgi:hypothetical protein
LQMIYNKFLTEILHFLLITLSLIGMSIPLFRTVGAGAVLNQDRIRTTHLWLTVGCIVCYVLYSLNTLLIQTVMYVIDIHGHLIALQNKKQV